MKLVWTLFGVVCATSCTFVQSNTTSGVSDDGQKSKLIAVCGTSDGTIEERLTFESSDESETTTDGTSFSNVRIALSIHDRSVEVENGSTIYKELIHSAVCEMDNSDQINRTLICFSSEPNQTSKVFLLLDKTKTPVRYTAEFIPSKDQDVDFSETTFEEMPFGSGKSYGRYYATTATETSRCLVGAPLVQ